MQPFRLTFKHGFRQYFITGLLVAVPLGLTGYILTLLIRFADQALNFLPTDLHPDNLLPFYLPGVGLLLALFVIFLVGLFSSNFVGRRVVEFGEDIIGRIPFVRNLHKAIKQLLETLFSRTQDQFHRVILMEYPRRGVHAIGFVTGTGRGEVQEKTNQNVLNVFLPTTPNPTSGFLLFVPEKEVIPLEMSVEEGLKLVISGGIVIPPWPQPDTEGKLEPKSTGRTYPA
ncbi:MAG: DUF502 domain-containing protein [Magnetococcales bacterium]|nr:DUF502 domain-containing protein [Magnetococcales bacterium]